MSTEIDDFINDNTSSGAPAFKFKDLGDTLKGTITARRIVESTDLNDPAAKVKNLVLDVTDDSGDEHTLWIKPGQMLAELGRALKAAGAVPGSPRPGDRVAVKFDHTEPPKQAFHSPKKCFTVAYKAGEPPAPSNVSVDDLLG